MIGTSITKELKVFKIVSEALQRGMKKKITLIHFMSMVSFFTPLKTSENQGLTFPVPIPSQSLTKRKKIT